MFQNINVTAKAIDASIMRVNVLTNNIANAETPNFKRSDVSFGTMLEEEIRRSGTDNIDLNKINAKVYTDYSSYSMRMDGNNVDIENEMSSLAKEKIRYDALIQRANAQLGRYTYILQSIK
ncbi:MAG: flagellar basal body rod protein FlgB [Cellulosilyticaceae bacterium]